MGRRCAAGRIIVKRYYTILLFADMFVQTESVHTVLSGMFCQLRNRIESAQIY